MKKYIETPSTRRKQFGYLLKTRWTDLVFSSIYLFIFMVPAIAWLLFGSMLVSSNDNLFNLMIIYLILIPLIIIYGIGTGGVMYSLKRMCYSEGSNIHKDLFYGIRKTYKDFIKVYLFIGIIYSLLHIGLSVIANANMDVTTMSIIQGIIYLAFFFMMMLANFNQSQMVFYNSSFSQTSVNSMKFSFGKILPNIGINLIYLLPLLTFELIQMCGNIDVISIVEWVCIGISGLFYFGFNKLLLLEYSISIFDETINKNQYLEIIKKGLKSEENDKNHSIDITTF